MLDLIEAKDFGQYADENGELVVCFLSTNDITGDISYPLYIVHYPVMYLFYAWLIDNKLYTLGETWQVVIIVMAINIALAYACLKLYDEPIRKRLSKKI